MRDIFEEIRFSTYRKNWWWGFLAVFAMTLLTKLNQVWLRSFFLMFSAFIWGTIDYTPSANVMLLIELLSGVAVFIGTAIWLFATEYRSPLTLGLFKEHAIRELCYGWLLAGGMLVLLKGVPLVLGLIEMKMTDRAFLLLGPLFFLAHHCYVMATVLIFQGYLLPFFAKYNQWLAILLTALLGTLFQWLDTPYFPLVVLVTEFMRYVLLNFIVCWRKNAWLVIGLEGLSLFLTYHLFSPEGFGWSSLMMQRELVDARFWTGGTLGMTGSAWYAIVLVVVIASILLIMKGNNNVR